MKNFYSLLETPPPPPPIPIEGEKSILIHLFLTFFSGKKYPSRKHTYNLS